MIKKRYNHTLQTNTRHREEKKHRITPTVTRHKSKATSSPFPSEMIAEAETTPSTAQQNKDQT